MATKTTKEARRKIYARVPSEQIVIGATSELYDRHKVGVHLTLISLSSIVAWTWIFAKALG